MPLRDFEIKCSIILTVYKRTEFVEQALDSLENQSVDKNLFEVLIISNIELKLSKTYNLNMQIIISDQLSLAGKIASGILLARNEVVTFLEDDDLYCKDRIEHILRSFRDNKDLDYYHNRGVHFRALTFLLKKPKICSVKSAQVLLDNKDKNDGDITKAAEYKLNKYQADYNLSSMAFRRTFISNYIEILSDLGTRYIDSFVFSVALYKGNSIIIDLRTDTLIRTHSLNASQAVETVEGPEKIVRYSKDMEKLKIAFDKMEISGRRFVEHFTLSRGLDDLMKAGNISRVVVFSRMKKLLKIYGRYFLRSDVTIKAFIYCISPNLMHKLLVLFHSI